MILNPLQLAPFWLYKLVAKNVHLATIFLQLVAKKTTESIINFEPCFK